MKQRPERWRPRGPKRWSYSWRDMADLFGTTEARVKYWVWRRRILDPSDLGSILKMANRLKRKGPTARCTATK